MVATPRELPGVPDEVLNDGPEEHRIALGDEARRHGKLHVAARFRFPQAGLLFPGERPEVDSLPRQRAAARSGKSEEAVDEPGHPGHSGANGLDLPAALLAEPFPEVFEENAAPSVDPA